ncbi:hypothetical protein [Streptomyces sp. NL15-2K]|uniref:hypothetical protein n=1 Tax=Streptomyces sp. NL15-2K TaxID=376149 RepID=UPI000F585944|nr:MULTISPECIES: hypothetical protein [Actinomycetes]WKX12040.1 hypothetical protein Q4V64_32815 [Kutzneria buriramensis]GCB46471.1 hypothetical protein SNL152K_3769 [Streptomyces sp. NL15-2K]
MARHASLRNPTARRALVVLATAGMALGAGAATASADATTSAGADRDRPTSRGELHPQAAPESATGLVGHVTGPVSQFQPNPLAGTGSDPLDNSVDTTVGDFRPVSTKRLTGPVAQAPSVGRIPVVGPVTRLPRG